MATPKQGASVPLMMTKKMESKLKGMGYDQSAIDKMKPQEAWDKINAPAADKDVAKIREWLKTQSADKQSRLGDMLEKGLVKEVKAELPAGWANKNPAQTAETTAPKAKGGKLKSTPPNPEIAAAKKKVEEEIKAAANTTSKAATDTAGKAADTAGKAAKGAAKEAGPVAKYMQGIGQEFKNVGKAAGKGLGKASGSKIGKAVLNNKMATAYGAIPAAGRAFEVYSDMNKGQSFMEALDKPESNKKLARQAVNTALVGIGSKLGALGGRFIGAPGLGAAAGGTLLPLVGDKAMDAMGILKSEEPKAVANEESAAPAGNAPSIGIEEASNWLKQKGMDPSADNFQKAFEELSKKQQEQINKTPEPKPSADTYKPSAKESVAMAEQAVKAPIGMQDKAPEPDIMSFLNNPDTQGMIAELSAKQANRVQSAGNIPDFKPRKKNEDDEDGMSPSSTTTANVRPPPRFFVNTGRFGTMAGGGSRRSPSGRLL